MDCKLCYTSACNPVYSDPVPSREKSGGSTDGCRYSNNKEQHMFGLLRAVRVVRNTQRCFVAVSILVAATSDIVLFTLQHLPITVKGGYCRRHNTVPQTAHRKKLKIQRHNELNKQNTKPKHDVNQLTAGETSN